MARNVGERHVEDTPKNRMFNALEAVMQMTIHTIKVCSNERIFKEEYSNVTRKIVETAVSAYISASDANNIDVRKTNQFYDYNVKKRLYLEQQAIECCKSMLGYITIASRLFHLRGKKTKYWISTAVKAREYLKTWHESEVKRFGQ